MSKVSPPGCRPIRARGHRPSREEINKIRREKKKAEKELRARQKAGGLEVPFEVAIPKCTCAYKTVKEEHEARQAVTTQ